MIWHNFSIFKTEARTCCEDFCGRRSGEMASEIPESFYGLGLQLSTCVSVEILP